MDPLQIPRDKSPQSTPTPTSPASIAPGTARSRISETVTFGSGDPII